MLYAFSVISKKREQGTGNREQETKYFSSSPSPHHPTTPPPHLHSDSMNKYIKKRHWKYLFWLGLFFVVIGLTVGLISENWGLLPLVFLILGFIICGMWLGLRSQNSKWLNSRAIQSSTNALVATISVLAILGLINFLGTRYHLRVDFTETQLFTLAPQSQKLVSSLPTVLKVWIFDRKENPQDRELLENYQRLSSKFKFEYINPQAKPGLVEKFGVKNLGEVYLELGNRRELVQTVNDNERLSEIKLTNRLQKIIHNITTKVYFLQGHGERPFAPGKDAISQAIQELNDRNFTTSELNLAEQSQVPNDANVIVVAQCAIALGK